MPSAFAREIGAIEGKRADMVVENSALVVKVKRPKKRRRYRLKDLLEGITRENYHPEPITTAPDCVLCAW